jgi:hypothetical protein
VVAEAVVGLGASRMLWRDADGSTLALLMG